MHEAEIPGLNIRQSRLILHALDHPREVFTIKKHQAHFGIAYQTARSDLLELEERGLLERHQKGRMFYFLATSKIKKFI